MQHLYSTGDSLSKIAYKYYGQAKYWWVIAWFNSKPTDFHCNNGDTILVPLPLEAAIGQAYNASEL
jgi:nucleoid-associated protein YgaU